MRSQSAQLVVECGFRNRTILNVEDKAVIVTEIADIQPLFELVPLAAHHDSVSVPVWFGARNDRVHDRCEVADPLEKISDLLVLQAELQAILEMLILASAALPKIG